MAFENRAQRKIFGPKWDDVTEEWRRLHNEELFDPYFSSNIRVIKSRATDGRSTWHVCGQERFIQDFSRKN
jgi:hypothetical protein